MLQYTPKCINFYGTQKQGHYLTLANGACSKAPPALLIAHSRSP